MQPASQTASSRATTSSRSSQQQSSKHLDKPTKKQLAAEIAVGIQFAQGGIGAVIPFDEDDVLTDQEVGMLARGIAAELLHYEGLLRWYLRLKAAGGPHAEFLAACFAIAAPRLAKRGILPDEIAMTIVFAGVSLSDTANAASRTATAVSVAPRRTPNLDGSDGVREVEYASPSTDLPRPLAIDSDQARQSDLPRPGDSNGEGGTSDAESALEAVRNSRNRRGRS